MNLYNKTKQAIGFLTLRMGIRQLKDIIYDIPVFNILFGKTLSDKLGLTSTELDASYFTTTEDNYREILARVYDILKDNPWTAEKADCDNRAEFTSSLISIVYNLNSVGRVWCRVYDKNTGVFKYLHWCNIIVDNNGKIFLFDADNGGLFQQITTKTPVLGGLKYELLNVRVG